MNHHPITRFHFPRDLKPFQRSLNELTEEAVWVIDNVFEDLEASFRILVTIHDLYPHISYATAADAEKPWTALWRARPASGRQPFFNSPAVIESTRFSPELAGLMVPVSEELAAALVGMSLAPRLYLDADHWRRLVLARGQAPTRQHLEKKLHRLFQENKPEQAQQLAQITTDR